MAKAQKNPVGRPRLGVHAVRVTLTLDDLQIARVLGEGETSRGLRRALEVARDALFEMERVEAAAVTVWPRDDGVSAARWRRVAEVLHGASLVLATEEARKTASWLGEVAWEHSRIKTGL